MYGPKDDSLIFIKILCVALAIMVIYYNIKELITPGLAYDTFFKPLENSAGLPLFFILLLPSLLINKIRGAYDSPKQ